MESDFNCVEVEAIKVEGGKSNENIVNEHSETKEDASVLDLTVHCEPSLIEDDVDLVENDYNER